MARARELRPQTRTQIDTLRDNLTEVERSLTTIKGMGRRAVNLLHHLDAVYENMARLQEQGVDVRPEQTRLEYVEERLHGDKMAELVREIARSEGWENLRARVAPEPDQWWWYLDQELTRRRRAQFRRWALRGGIILLALALLVGAYRAFLAPSPETEQRIALMQQAERHIEKGDLAQAIANYEEAATLEPDNPEIHLWLGVLYDQTGQRETAIAAFRSAREFSPSMYDYFLLRSRIYLQLDMLDKAAGDALAALEISPNSTQALFLLADVLERQGNYAEAMILFHKVSLEAENPTLQVLAKVRYGMLLEAGPREELGTPPPES